MFLTLPSYFSRPIQLLCIFLLFLPYPNREEDEQPLTLWYNQPAEVWTEALPIGNGSLGAMIFGGISEERIQFNEETLWTGKPRDYHRDGASEYLSDIRQLLFEDKQDEAEALAERVFMGKKENEDTYEDEVTKWVEKVRALEGVSGNPAAADYNDEEWEEMPVPLNNGWREAGLEGRNGAIWFRTSFELPDEWDGEDIILSLGRIRDHDFTYINGHRAGSINDKDENRMYRIPHSRLKKGSNVIAVQVLNYYDKGGFTGASGGNPPLSVFPESQGEESDQAIPLSGSWKYKIQDLDPPAYPEYMANYQPFGDLRIRFENHDQATDYRRELNITDAVARTSYEVDGTRYTREYFTSAPDQVMVTHFTADKSGKISFEAALSSPHLHHSTRKIDDNTLGLSVKVRNGALEGESRLHIRSKNGEIDMSDNRITVKDADEATLFLSAATNYINFEDVSGNPDALTSNVIREIKQKDFKAIKSDHIADYRQLFDTFSINLGDSSNRSMPTDKRIEEFYTSDDPSLVALYTQYGRYLLISSSRPGSQPANLQGIWNDKLSPPWGSKYTTNINVEMNYWPAELLNLSSTHEPLIQMTKELAQTGRKTAKAHYDSRGWVLHHNTDLWRGTAPVNASNHGIWVTGGAWLSHRLWERYQFTRDTTFLRETAYPVMKEAATFFVDFLIKDPENGWLISTPSNSPEIGGLVAGPTMDHQLIRDLFKNSIAAGEILDVDHSFRDTLKEKFGRIAPNQIGRHGQLQEWLEDKDDPDEKHRHVSHLWGLHPGSEINWKETPELNEAARQSLIFRGDGGTGWSLAWKINFWARFKDGDHAYELVKKMLSPAENPDSEIEGASYPNLLDAHPPFQIDGNFGGAAGIAEMLLQSHINNTIHILPALPSALADGEIEGIKARGGFELDMKWANGKLQRLEILSTAGNECRVMYGDKEIRFDTDKGQLYKLDGNLNRL